jgi:hypothetical protein
MDPATKARAKKKADNIVEHIGYPPELLNTKKLEELVSMFLFSFFADVVAKIS